MSLLLCSQEYARRPYHVEMLGIHLFTAQELAYVIYHYPLLVLDGFINDDLLEFLKEELNLGMLAVKLERWLKRQEKLDEALVLILQECGYYNGVEINRFRHRLMDLRKKHPAEFSKLKADELFSMHQYTRAARLYEELLDRPADKHVDDTFLVKVLNNLGACHAQTFHFDKAYEAYEKALGNAQNWFMYQKSLLDVLYKISDLRYTLHLGAVSREQCVALLPTYTKQVSDTQERLTAWHDVTTQRLGIEADEIRRKRTGFDSVIHFIPGLFNDDFNFRSIEKKTAKMITAQASGHESLHVVDTSELYAEDVQLISKDGKIYYLPESKAE